MALRNRERSTLAMRRRLRLREPVKSREKQAQAQVMRKYLLLPAIALLVVARPAWSIDIETIGGEYVGKVNDAKGVGPSKGDTCHVSINPEGRASTVEFELEGAPSTAFVERNEVARGLKKGSAKVRLTTTSQKGKKVFVVLKFKGEPLLFVRVKVMDHATVRWTIACGRLART